MYLDFIFSEFQIVVRISSKIKQGRKIPADRVLPIPLYWNIQCPVNYEECNSHIHPSINYYVILYYACHYFIKFYPTKKNIKINVTGFQKFIRLVYFILFKTSKFFCGYVLNLWLYYANMNLLFFDYCTY